MTQLSPEVRALVMASRPGLEPTADDLASGRTRLIAAMAAGAAGVATATAASAASAASATSAVSATSVAAGTSTAVAASTALKLGAIVVGLGAAVGGGKLVVDRVSQSAPPQQVARAPQQVEMPAPDLPAPVVTPIAAPTATTPIQPAVDPDPEIVSPPKRPRRTDSVSAAVTDPDSDPDPAAVTDPDPDPDTDTDTDTDTDPVTDPDPDPDPATPSQLSVELSLLDGARRAIRASDFPTARTLLDEHRRRFPDGQLAEERTRIARTLPASPPPLERTSP